MTYAFVMNVTLILRRRIPLVMRLPGAFDEATHARGRFAALTDDWRCWLSTLRSNWPIGTHHWTYRSLSIVMVAVIIFFTLFQPAQVPPRWWPVFLVITVVVRAPIMIVVIATATMPTVRTWPVPTITAIVR